MGKKKSKAQQGPPDTYIEADPEEAAQDAAKAGAVIPESALGKKMASADKKTRDKAVLVMSKWMAQQHSLDEDDHLKIWKALYYCYWMSDKPLVQQELASKLAELIHVFPSMQQSMLYFRTFFMTMLREWQGIDRLRLDKFYNLVRCFQREAFGLLGRTGWKPSDVTAYNNIMAGVGGVLRKDCQVVGLQLHVCDIVLDELSDSMKSGLTPEGFMHLMSPYISLMRETPDKAVFARLYRGLESLAGEQWLTASLKDGEGEEEEEDPLTTQPLRHNNRMFKHTYVPPIPKQSVNDMCKDKAFAGSVMHALTRRIFRITISPSTFEMNRRKLYELLEVCKESCTALDRPFTEDPDDVSDEEEGETGSKKALGGHSEAGSSSSAGKKRARDSEDQDDVKAKGSEKKGSKKRPAQAHEVDNEGHYGEEEGKVVGKKKRKSEEGDGGRKALKGGKKCVEKSGKKGKDGGSDAKSSEKKKLLQEASEEAAENVLEVKSRPGKLSVEDRKKLRMSIDSLSNTHGLLSSERTLSPVRHAASAADFFTGKIKVAEEGCKGKKGGPAKKKASAGKTKKGGK